MNKIAGKLRDVLNETISCLSPVEEETVECALKKLAAYENTGLEPEEVAPVVHGRYISEGMDELYCDFGDCSVCGGCMPEGSKYCPNCGAKMDMEEPAHE